MRYGVEDPNDISHMVTPNLGAEQVAYMPSRAAEGYGYKDQFGVRHIRQSEANKVIAAYAIGGVLLGTVAMYFKMKP